MLVLVMVLVGVGCCVGSVLIVFCACVVLCVLMCVWACAAFETWFVLLVVGGLSNAHPSLISPRPLSPRGPCIRLLSPVISPCWSRAVAARFIGG